jgi:hypothetical protein
VVRSIDIVLSALRVLPPALSRACLRCLSAGSFQRQNRPASTQPRLRVLHVILVVRRRRHQPTRDYMARRLTEVVRCLNRYIARETFHALQSSIQATKIIA